MGFVGLVRVIILLLWSDGFWLPQASKVCPVAVPYVQPPLAVPVVYENKNDNHRLSATCLRVPRGAATSSQVIHKGRRGLCSVVFLYTSTVWLKPGLVACLAKKESYLKPTNYSNYTHSEEEVYSLLVARTYCAFRWLEWWVPPMWRSMTLRILLISNDIYVHTSR